MAVTPVKYVVQLIDKATGSVRVGVNVKITLDSGSNFLPVSEALVTDANGIAVIDVSVIGNYDVWVAGSLNTDYQAQPIIPLESNLIRCVDTNADFDTKNINGANYRSSGDGANASGTVLGYHEFYNADESGDGPNVVAFMEARSGSATGADGELFFGTYTTGLGEGTRAVDRWKIDRVGDKLPTSDNAYNLGSASFRVKELFSANGTINTSDKNLKAEIKSIPSELKNAFKPLKPKMYKYKDAVNEKGSENARWHVGYIAQDVEKCLVDAGLNPDKYSFLCKDEIFDDRGISTGEYRYGLRYSELMILMELINA